MTVGGEEGVFFHNLVKYTLFVTGTKQWHFPIFAHKADILVMSVRKKMFIYGSTTFLQFPRCHSYWRRRSIIICRWRPRYPTHNELSGLLIVDYALALVPTTRMRRTHRPVFLYVSYFGLKCRGYDIHRYLVSNSAVEKEVYYGLVCRGVALGRTNVTGESPMVD